MLYVLSQMLCQRNDLPNQTFSLFKADLICDSLSRSYPLEQCHQIHNISNGKYFKLVSERNGSFRGSLRREEFLD